VVIRSDGTLFFLLFFSFSFTVSTLDGQQIFPPLLSRNSQHIIGKKISLPSGKWAPRCGELLLPLPQPHSVLLIFPPLLRFLFSTRGSFAYSGSNCFALSRRSSLRLQPPWWVHLVSCSFTSYGFVFFSYCNFASIPFPHASSPFFSSMMNQESVSETGELRRIKHRRRLHEVLLFF